MNHRNDFIFLFLEHIRDIQQACLRHKCDLNSGFEIDIDMIFRLGAGAILESVADDGLPKFCGKIVESSLSWHC